MFEIKADSANLTIPSFPGTPGVENSGSFESRDFLTGICA